MGVLLSVTLSDLNKHLFSHSSFDSSQMESQSANFASGDVNWTGKNDLI